MQLTYTAPSWIALSSYDERDIPKKAGFRWNPAAKRWETWEAGVARKLQEYADDAARLAMDAALTQHDTAVTASRAMDANIEIPCPDGLAYRPFQRAGVQFLAEHAACLLGDEMGTGKTIQTAGLLNLCQDIHRVLVVCPASLRLNWRRELERWIVAERRLAVHIATTKEALETLRAFWDDAAGGLRVVILNYDILHTFETKRAEEYRTKDGQRKTRDIWAFPYGGLDLLVADEAHYLKNDTSRRSKAVRCIAARRRLLLTGTPLVNRPKELYPMLNYLDPQEWGSFWRYGMRYCNAHQISIGRGRTAWDFSGASHLDELQDRLRSTLMLRRLKRDVLTELPAKQRQVIELPANGASKAVSAEMAAVARHGERLSTLQTAVELAKASESDDTYEDAVAALRSGAQAAFTEMSTLRHDTAVAKIPYVVAHAQEALEADEAGKLILFAHHHDVVAGLQAGLAEYGPVILTGEISSPVIRQAAVDRFQTDPTCRVFIGSITTAGVGITLTASSHVIFAELDWVPGNITQAEDRAHRIGQTGMVLVQHLVLEGSLDATMARRLVAKQAVLDAALDTPGSQDAAADLHMPLIPLTAQEEPATASLSRKRIAEDATALTPADISHIHACLQYLAGVCDGAARLDGHGYNKIDAPIGHSLAACASLTAKQAALGKRFVTRYRRQLDTVGL